MRRCTQLTQDKQCKARNRRAAVCILNHKLLQKIATSLSIINTAKKYIYITGLKYRKTISLLGGRGIRERDRQAKQPTDKQEIKQRTCAKSLLEHGRFVLHHPASSTSNTPTSRLSARSISCGSGNLKLCRGAGSGFRLRGLCASLSLAGFPLILMRKNAFLSGNFRRHLISN